MRWRKYRRAGERALRYGTEQYVSLAAEPRINPNPPITEERLGFWITQPGICAEETPWAGMRRALTAGVSGRRPPQVVQCERGRHSAPSFEKGVCKSADKHDILVRVGSSDHRQQAQALPIGGRPLAHGGHAQDQSSGMVNQPPWHMEEQEAQAFGAGRQ